MVRIVNTIAKSITEINESAKDMITVQYINPDENRILKFGLLTKNGNIKEIIRVKEQRTMSDFKKTLETLSNLFIKTPPFIFNLYLMI